MALLVTSCTSVRVSNTPPDLSNCSQLGWVESTEHEFKSAKKEMEKHVYKMGGNYLYALPLQSIESSKINVYKGLAYKCVN